MKDTAKIVYVLGDGRSGSTLLDSILATKENSVSIGEGYRFWERFYKKDTKCCCDVVISECPFWGNVHRHLEKTIPDYNPKRINQLIKKYSTYKYALEINKGLENEETAFLFKLIVEFYAAISNAGSDIDYIIDSSKSPGWAILMARVQNLNIKFIHLERDLTSVASSWKKRLLLPEYVFENKYMPIKTDSNIIRTWLRVKILSKKLSGQNNYFFLKYSVLCNDSKALIALNAFLNWELKPPFLSKTTHAIAGNPSRVKGNEIKIRPYRISKENLNPIQLFYFGVINTIAEMTL